MLDSLLTFDQWLVRLSTTDHNPPVATLQHGIGGKLNIFLEPAMMITCYTTLLTTPTALTAYLMEPYGNG